MTGDLCLLGVKFTRTGRWIHPVLYPCELLAGSSVMKLYRDYKTFIAFTLNRPEHRSNRGRVYVSGPNTSRR